VENTTGLRSNQSKHVEKDKQQNAIQVKNEDIT
jgi:hypothetical protein